MRASAALPLSTGKCWTGCWTSSASSPTSTLTLWSPARLSTPSPPNAFWAWKKFWSRQSPSWFLSMAIPPPPLPGRWPPFTSRSRWDMWRPAFGPMIAILPSRRKSTAPSWGISPSSTFAPQRPTGKTCGGRGSRKGSFSPETP
ncbi:hypothetical protein SDC9_68298 [bioreactor metagenome]|uniref:Uncharacterized protein n=1 Tax=bioreactor metagenome TaxID=1076179 RepID=A0A644Y1E9_9ZZZZ